MLDRLLSVWTIQGPETPVEKLLLHPKEAAEMLSVSKSKVYELMAAGRLRSVRIDNCRRIPLDALRAYVAQLDRDENEGATEFAA